MRKALRRAGMTMTAGLLGLASPALAQYAAHTPGATTSQVKPVPAPVSYFTPPTKAGDSIKQGAETDTVVSSVTGAPVSYAIQTADGQAPAPLLEGHSRLEEMKVEIALLGDPTTFPYHLDAHMEGPALQLRGFVPNDSIRKHALTLAQASTVLTVSDAMKIHTKLSMRVAGVPVQELEKAAVDLLTEHYPEIVEGIEVKAKSSGQVILGGSVRSYEERLNISRQMRKLTGCTSVVNQLKVIPVVKDGNSLTMVTADGQHMVPNEIAEDGVMGTPAKTVVTAPKPLMLPAMPAVNVAPKQTPTMLVPTSPPAPAMDPLQTPPAKATPAQTTPVDRIGSIIAPPPNSMLLPSVGERGTVTTGVISFISAEPDSSTAEKP
jgi:hypothetical protein